MDCPTIYIVDDDEAVRVAVCLLLRSFGWKTRSFASAPDALVALQSQRPDCLLLDLNMPGMNGAELLEALMACHLDIPTVAVSGLRDSPLVDRVRAAGVNEMLAKPFDDVELKLSIERALSV